MAVRLEERVDGLETLFGQFVAQTGSALLRMERGILELKNETRIFQKEMKDFKDEMKVFKDEMTDFKDEMTDFKNEMIDFKNEMTDFKDEMKVFKDEMKVFKDETKAERREMNKQWGNLANKMGTLVEDLIYPSIGRIIQEEFDLKPESIMIRITRILPDGRNKEFDAIALAGDKLFFNSTKTTLKNEYVKEFIYDIATFRDFFPEYQSRKIIGILAALNIPLNALKYAERKGFVVLGVGDKIMESKNSRGFKPKEW
ncbi:MAG TPA: hypothetical protein ENH29_03455 [Bacteroidetes bacterium]|nr:hypothetical protein [Bacteroidota bacterium]